MNNGSPWMLPSMVFEWVEKNIDLMIIDDLHREREFQFSQQLSKNEV